MIIESEDEVKKIKQMVGVIQACKLPEMRGLDAFAIHNTCEWAYNCALDFEKKKEEKKDITDIAQDVTDHGMKKKRLLK